MTFGTLGGDASRRTPSCGRRNPWAELFDPGRAKIRRGLWDYIKENKDYPYYTGPRSVRGRGEPIVARGEARARAR